MSAPRLYHSWFDSRDQDQWFLGDPHDPAGRMVYPESFTGGERVEVPDGLVVPVDNPGHPLDFSFGSFDMPVVTEPVGALLDRIAGADVQRIPVRVQGRSEPYEILNVVTVVDCIDRERTIGELWTEEDGDTDEVGGYRIVYELWLESRPDRRRADLSSGGMDRRHGRDRRGEAGLGGRRSERSDVPGDIDRR